LSFVVPIVVPVLVVVHWQGGNEEEF